MRTTTLRSSISSFGPFCSNGSEPRSAAGAVGARRSARDSLAASSPRRAAKSAEAEPEQHSFWFSSGFLLSKILRKH